MNWTYKGKEMVSIENFEPWVFGFVYEIEYKSGKKYLGKKNLLSYIEKDALLNGNKRKGHIKFLNRIKKRKRVKRELTGVESNWKTYSSSSTDIPKDDKIVAKRILFMANRSQQLSYLEERELFRVEASVNTQYHNLNIGGRYFKDILD